MQESKTVRKGEITFQFCPRCGVQMNPNYDPLKAIQQPLLQDLAAYLNYQHPSTKGDVKLDNACRAIGEMQTELSECKKACGEKDNVLRDAQMFIESYFIDWARLNNDSPDYGAKYQPEFPEIVKQITDARLSTAGKDYVRREELDKVLEVVRAALPILRHHARVNPKWRSPEFGLQDPDGVHSTLEQADRIIEGFSK